MTLCTWLSYTEPLKTLTEPSTSRKTFFFFFYLEISESDVIINGLKNMKEEQKIGILEEAHAFEIQ